MKTPYRIEIVYDETNPEQIKKDIVAYEGKLSALQWSYENNFFADAAKTLRDKEHHEVTMFLEVARAKLQEIETTSATDDDMPAADDDMPATDDDMPATDDDMPSDLEARNAEIRRLSDAGEKQRDIAARFNVTVRTIQRVLSKSKKKTK